MSLPIKDLGPCAVIWDLDDANVTLNPTFGGVIFRTEELFVGIKEDQAGVVDVDATYTGRTAELVVPMTRSSLDQLEAVITGSTKGADFLKVKNRVGHQMFADAKEIILKPTVDGTPSTTDTEWLHIHRCYPVASLEFVYDNAGQRVCNVVFKVFPDDLSGQVNEMWRIGPEE